MQVNSLDRNPLQETFLDYVKVTSTSAGEQYLNMYYAGEHWYNNWVYPGELLYLATDNLPGDGDHIKVVDEEVLKFWLEIQPGSGSYRSCKTVMVDRGEYAGCGLDSYFANITKFKDQMEEPDVDWFQAGHVEYPDNVGSQVPCPMKTFIEDAGSNTDDNKESDFMMFVCHGKDNGNLYDNNTPKQNLIMNAPNAAIWSREVEWVWALTCSILAPPPEHAGRMLWDDALKNGAHMILGYYDPVGSDQTGEINNFFNHAGGDPGSADTIVTSFYYACSDWVDDPGAIVLHRDNDTDKLKVVTRDTTSIDMRYYWLEDGDWNYNNYLMLGGDYGGPTKYKSYANCQIEIRMQLPKALRPKLVPIEGELLPLRSTPEDFNHFRRLYGHQVFWKSLPHHELVYQDKQKAEEAARRAVMNIFGEIPDSNQEVTDTSTFYGIDYKKGEMVDLSAGIPLVRRVKFYHYYEGVPIDGDILSVSVARDDVVQIQACWHRIVGQNSEQKRKVVDVEDSLGVALETLAQKFPSEKELRFTLRGANLCYYGYHDAGKSKKILLPVWRFTFEKDGRLYNQYVHAHNNKAINAEKDIPNARNIMKIRK